MKHTIISLALTAALSGTAGAGAGHSGAHDAHADKAAKPTEQHGDEQRHGQHAHEEQTNVSGTPADKSEATKTISVTLLDSMRIEFDQDPALKRGDVVHFIIYNQGKIRHEFSIGDAAEQKAHLEMMRKNPDMPHTDANTVSLEGGKSADLVWRFDGSAEELVFACNIPGHSEAGMLTKLQLKP